MGRTRNLVFSALTAKQILLVSAFLALPVFAAYCVSPFVGFMVAAGSLVAEIAAFITVGLCRKSFPWLITSKDLYPEIDPVSLQRFVQFGFDSEIGWVRKAHTEKSEIGQNGKPTCFSIDADGSRANPGHERLPKEKAVLYGDSFAFSRQVNDNESLQWYLSEMLQANVCNFGVGNYGFDQALLRFRRLRRNFAAEVTLFGLVPSTIVRIHDVWKHYNEFGNIYGFKPRFVLETDGTLALRANPARSAEDIAGYKKFLPQIQRDDLFYRRKFLHEVLRFPYFFHILSQPARNLSLIRLIGGGG